MENSNIKGRQIVTVWATRAGKDSIRVWPDGCRDLILCFKPAEGPTAILTGLDTSPYSIRVPEDTVFIGVRLAPGSVAKWEPQVEVRPGDVFQSHHPGYPSASWLDFVAQHPERSIELLVEATERWFHPASSAVEDFLGELHHTSGRVPRLTINQRTLRRQIRAATGASPQFWVGLYRARFAGRALLLSNAPIIDIALSAGYADQAHMTREMRRWFGITPAALRINAASYGHLVTMPDAFTPEERLANVFLSPI